MDLGIFGISQPKLEMVAFLMYISLRLVEGHRPHIIPTPGESTPKHTGHSIRQGNFSSKTPLHTRCADSSTCTPLPDESDCQTTWKGRRSSIAFQLQGFLVACICFCTDKYDCFASTKSMKIATASYSVKDN